MNTTAQLQAQLVPLAPQVAQIKKTLRLVAAKEQVPLELVTAVRVLTKDGYLRYSDRAKRLMFTEQGQKFYRQMRRFG